MIGNECHMNKNKSQLKTTLSKELNNGQLVNVAEKQSAEGSESSDLKSVMCQKTH